MQGGRALQPSQIPEGWTPCPELAKQLLRAALTYSQHFESISLQPLLLGFMHDVALTNLLVH